METIKDIFVIGPGPSSSHTIGPMNAAKDFISNLNNIDSIDVTLYGSLSLTGIGHRTDKILKDALNKYKTKIIFSKDFNDLKHPNTLKFVAYKNSKIIKEQIYYSIGGGKILKENSRISEVEIYKLNTLTSIVKYIEKKKIDLSKYVSKIEDDDLDSYLELRLEKMFELIERNINKEGVLPGKLKIKRVAKRIYENALQNVDEQEKALMIITSFAYACSEGNASNDIVVTAPTCGSCGVLPAILYYEYKFKNIGKEKLINALKVAGLFGNLCKKNATISGAVAGCQAEIGVASSMAAAALSYIYDLNTYQIEYAAEVALEHFLGLSCDPVDSYVMIPCIERNGIGALRAYNSFLYAKNIALFRKNKVSFDDVVQAMKETGAGLNQDFKETSVGGLAKIIK